MSLMKSMQASLLGKCSRRELPPKASEERAGVVIGLVPAQFGDPLEAHGFGHLRVRMQVVEHVHALGHGCQDPFVGEAAGAVQILPFAGDGVGIGQDLVHSAVLVAHHFLHLGVAEAGGQFDGPVAEAQEQRLGGLVPAVEPGVPEARVHLMDVVERSPRAGIHAEIPLLEIAPDPLAVGHAAHIALAPVRMVPDIGLRTQLQFADHVLHPLPALVIAHGGVHGHRAQVMARHMPVEPVPVGVGRLPGLQPGLLPIGSQQPIAVVLQQGFHVQVPRVLERSFQQGHVPQGKLVRIQTVLRLRRRCGRQQRKDSQYFHSHHFRNMKKVFF